MTNAVINLRSLCVHALAALVVVALSGCGPKMPLRLGPQMKVMATDAEKDMGRAAHPEILNQYGRYDDEVLQGYVQRVGEQLVLASFGEEKIFRFTVLDSDEVNAFSIPGGYIYITRGLIACLNSETELAVVLAHEIAHVTQRHAAHHLFETQVAEDQLVVGSMLIHSMHVQQAIDLFKSMGNTLLEGYEAKEEMDATRLSATIAAAAGYNPAVTTIVRTNFQRYAEFETQLANEENRAPHIYHGVKSNDPAAEKELQEFVAKIKFKERASDAIENLDRFFGVIDGLVWGDSAVQGQVSGRQYQNAEWGVALTAPDGWRTYNQSTRVLWAPRTLDAYIEVQLYAAPENIGPQEFLRTEIDVQEITDGALFSPNGLPGYTAVAKFRTPYGNQRGRVYVIFANDRAFVFKSAGRTETVRAFYNDAYSAMVGTFRAMLPEERLKVQVRRVKVIAVDKAVTFESLVPKTALTSRARDQLRVINQMYPAGQPRPGQRVKIIG